MNKIFMIMSIISVIGIILVWCSFWENLKQLTVFQKTSLLITSVGILIPFIVGFINGFLGH